jgi:hypothetical protein
MHHNRIAFEIGAEEKYQMPVAIPLNKRLFVQGQQKLFSIPHAAW